MPPRTAARLPAMVRELVPPGQANVDVVWNPELLEEGRAVEDTLKPHRIVVGASRSSASQLVEGIYRPLTDSGIPLIVTNLATAELAKGAANAFLAMKISFINAGMGALSSRRAPTTCVTRPPCLSPGGSAP